MLCRDYKGKKKSYAYVFQKKDGTGRDAVQSDVPFSERESGGVCVRRNSRKETVKGTAEFESAKQAAYRQAKQAFRAQAFTAPKPARQFGKPQGGRLDYGVGDRVRHMKFGEGKVAAIVEGGRDFEVTVDFDGAGRKKMFAGFARLEKI